MEGYVFEQGCNVATYLQFVCVNFVHYDEKYFYSKVEIDLVSATHVISLLSFTSLRLFSPVCVAAGKATHTINTKGENINICWSPNGQTIAVGNKVGKVWHLWIRRV